MSETRILRPGDEAQLFGFLRKRTESVTLMLSNLGRVGLKREDHPYEGCYAGHFENGQLVAVAAHYWNGMLFIEAPIHAAQLARLAVERSGYALRGFYGPAHEVGAVRSGLGLALTPTRLAVEPNLMVLDLDAIRLPEALAAPDVRVRRARVGEQDLLVNWRAQFEIEVTGARDSADLRDEARETVARLARDRHLWVLEVDGQLVAKSGLSGIYGDLAQVGYVWTQPKWRGRGYGRAVVAGMLKKAHGEGFARASLIADDVAAKRAYLAIGFTAIAKQALVLLEEEVPWRLSA